MVEILLITSVVYNFDEHLLWFLVFAIKCFDLRLHGFWFQRNTMYLKVYIIWLCRKSMELIKKEWCEKQTPVNDKKKVGISVSFACTLYNLWFFTFKDYFLAHLSQRPKWAFQIKMSVVIIIVFFVNFLHFWLILKNHRANFKHTWHKASLGIQVCENEGQYMPSFKWR